MKPFPATVSQEKSHVRYWLFCLHKWKRLAERTVIETFCGREDGRYDVLTEECEKCGKIRQINLRGK